MKKRLLSLLLCAVMLFACASPAFAASPSSVNKVTPPELPVSEYPLIIVRGMQLNGMVRYGGTEKEEKASVNFNAADLLKTLVKIPSAPLIFATSTTISFAKVVQFRVYWLYPPLSAKLSAARSTSLTCFGFVVKLRLIS